MAIAAAWFSILRLKCVVSRVYHLRCGVIGLALYTSTLSRLREVGVMKALGAWPRRLVRVVLSQALWTVGAAVALAIALALGLAWVLARATGNISVMLQAAAVIRVTVAGAVLGALGPSPHWSR